MRGRRRWIEKDERNEEGRYGREEEEEEGGKRRRGRGGEGRVGSPKPFGEPSSSSKVALLSTKSANVLAPGCKLAVRRATSACSSSNSSRILPSSSPKRPRSTCSCCKACHRRIESASMNFLSSANPGASGSGVRTHMGCEDSTAPAQC